MLAAVVLGGVIGTKQLDQNTIGPGESGRMAKILDEEFKQPAGEPHEAAASTVGKRPQARACGSDVPAAELDRPTGGVKILEWRTIA